MLLIFWRSNTDISMSCSCNIGQNTSLMPETILIVIPTMMNSVSRLHQWPSNMAALSPTLNLDCFGLYYL